MKEGSTWRQQSEMSTGEAVAASREAAGGGEERAAAGTALDRETVKDADGDPDGNTSLQGIRQGNGANEGAAQGSRKRLPRTSSNS